jgi:hypothetical protein
MWSADAQKDSDDESEEESEEDSEEDSEDEESDDDTKKPAADASRSDRKAEKKARKEAAIRKAKGKNVQVGDMPSSESEEESEDEDDDMPANPNHSKAARKQAAKPQGASSDDEDGGDAPKKPVSAMSRKEREAFEAAEAQKKFMKMHLSGKTDEAKSDLARLQEVRARRAEEAARREVSAPFPNIYCCLKKRTLTSIGRASRARRAGERA